MELKNKELEFDLVECEDKLYFNYEDEYSIIMTNTSI